MSVIVPAFDLFNPRILEAIRDAVFAFCAATNATALGDVAAAQEKLRAELAAGLEAGESLARLSARVGAIFRDPEKALTIAATEASRAVHAGQAIAAKESGVCQGLRWLASSDACDFCLKLDGKEVPFDTPFAVVGNNPVYSRIYHPPGHPRCMCAATEVIEFETPQPERVEPEPTPPPKRPLPPAPVAPPAPPKPSREPPDRTRIRPDTPQTLAQSLASYKPGNEAIRAAVQHEKELKRLEAEKQKRFDAFDQKDKLFWDAVHKYQADRENAALNAEMEKAGKAQGRAHRAFVKAHEAVQKHVEGMRDQVWDAIRGDLEPGQLAAVVLDPQPLDASGEALHPNVKASIDHAKDFYAKTLASKAKVLVHVTVNQIPRNRPLEDQRAFYLGGAIHLTACGAGIHGAGVAVHEVGHYLEEQIPGLHDAVKRFQELRFKDEPFASLAEAFPGHGYEPWEKGRKDKMDVAFGERSAYYVGKEYPQNSEIVSMGLQKLYEDPIGFARKDPQYFKFCVAALRGDFK